MPEIGTSGSMSGDGKRSAAAWPKLPRPSSTLPRTGRNCLCRTRRGINRNDGRAVKEGLFYVRRHTCADGSFEWYVLNGHTRRPASKLFRTRAAAAAERARLQVKLELAKEQVLKRTLTRTGPQKYRTSGPR